MEELKITPQLADVARSQGFDKLSLKAVETGPSFNGLLSGLLSLLPPPVAAPVERATSARPTEAPKRESSPAPVSDAATQPTQRRSDASAAQSRADAREQFADPARDTAVSKRPDRPVQVIERATREEPMTQQPAKQPAVAETTGPKTPVIAEDAPQQLESMTPEQFREFAMKAAKALMDKRPGEGGFQGMGPAPAPTEPRLYPIENEVPVVMETGKPAAETSADRQLSITLPADVELPEDMVKQPVRIQVMETPPEAEATAMPKTAPYQAPGSDMQMDLGEIEEFVAKYNGKVETVEETADAPVKPSSEQPSDAKRILPEVPKAVVAQREAAVQPEAKPVVPAQVPMKSADPAQPTVTPFDVEAAVQADAQDDVAQPQKAVVRQAVQVTADAMPEEAAQPQPQPAQQSGAVAQSVAAATAKVAASSAGQQSAGQNAGQFQQGTSGGAAFQTESVQGPGPAQGGSSSFTDAVRNASEARGSRQTEMVDRITAMLKNNGTRMSQTFRMALTPAHLGGVRVDLNVRGGTVNVHVVTESHQATHVLQNGAQDLRAALEQSGIQLGGFDVSSGGADQDAQHRANDDSQSGRQGGFERGLRRGSAEEDSNAMIPLRSWSGQSGLDLVA